MLIHGNCKRSKNTPTYQTWVSMRQRCNNTNSPDYPNYGGRGIKICPSWDSFPQFLSDMGERPKGTSLDRIDFNGDYCKENCRWASPKLQALNTRTTYLLEFNGETDSIHGWSKRLNITEQMIKYNHERGLPLDHRFKAKKGSKYNGKTLFEWSKELGVKYYTLARYVRLHGIDQALEFYGSQGAL